MGNQNVALARYRTAIDQLRLQYASLASPGGVRLAKKTSNLFRFGNQRDGGGLRVDEFANVLVVDPVARTADVGGMTTYEDLVDATLLHGLMPLVVPQLKTITLGGAVTGLGIESSSFRNGLPHESVLEMDVLTPDGEVRTVSPDNGDSSLFFGFPNSYGTLGYALRLKIELEPVHPLVRLRHIGFDDPKKIAQAISDITDSGYHEGEAVDFLDGTVFSTRSGYLTLGQFVDQLPAGVDAPSDYTGQGIYYQSIPRRSVDYLTIRDYLWRWDTDWFWCSKALGVQNPVVRRFIPHQYLRSDVYRRIVAWDARKGVTAALDKARGKPRLEKVIQDVEIPVERLAEFLEFFEREVGISPVWLCPVRLRGERTWPLYPMEPGKMYVNVGFWATAPLPDGERDGFHNRKIEDEVSALDGHKSLYSTAFYSEEEFGRRYNGDAYRKLKAQYDPAGRFMDLYQKVVRN
jgi:FAD/FMN-containing dehydrogenase